VINRSSLHLHLLHHRHNQHSQRLAVAAAVAGRTGIVLCPSYPCWPCSTRGSRHYSRLSIVLGLFIRSSIVRELASPDLARGVITFIFAVGTVGIALLLAVGALVGQHSVEEFAKAKEILTVLIGVFGTILGFYFGTAAGGGQKLDVRRD